MTTPVLKQISGGTWRTTVLVSGTSQKCPAGKHYESYYSLETTSPNLKLTPVKVSGVAKGNPSYPAGTSTPVTYSCEVRLTFYSSMLRNVPATATLVIDGSASLALAVSRKVTLYYYFGVPAAVGGAMALVLFLLSVLFTGIYDIEGVRERRFSKNFWTHPLSAFGAWTISDSWATNIATVVGFIGVSLGLVSATDTLFRGVAVDRFGILVAIAAGFATAAPLLFGALYALWTLSHPGLTDNAQLGLPGATLPKSSARGRAAGTAAELPTGTVVTLPEGLRRPLPDKTLVHLPDGTTISIAPYSSAMALTSEARARLEAGTVTVLPAGAAVMLPDGGTQTLRDQMPTPLRAAADAVLAKRTRVMPPAWGVAVLPAGPLAPSVTLPADTAVTLPDDAILTCDTVAVLPEDLQVQSLSLPGGTAVALPGGWPATLDRDTVVVLTDVVRVPGVTLPAGTAWLPHRRAATLNGDTVAVFPEGERVPGVTLRGGTGVTLREDGPATLARDTIAVRPDGVRVPGVTLSAGTVVTLLYHGPARLTHDTVAVLPDGGTLPAGTAVMLPGGRSAALDRDTIAVLADGLRVPGITLPGGTVVMLPDDRPATLARDTIAVLPDGITLPAGTAVALREDGPATLARDTDALLPGGVRVAGVILPAGTAVMLPDDRPATLARDTIAVLPDGITLPAGTAVALPDGQLATLARDTDAVVPSAEEVPGVTLPVGTVATLSDGGAIALSGGTAVGASNCPLAPGVTLPAGTEVTLPDDRAAWLTRDTAAQLPGGAAATISSEPTVTSKPMVTLNGLRVTLPNETKAWLSAAALDHDKGTPVTVEKGATATLREDESFTIDCISYGPGADISVPSGAAIMVPGGAALSAADSGGGQPTRVEAGHTIQIPPGSQIGVLTEQITLPGGSVVAVEGESTLVLRSPGALAIAGSDIAASHSDDVTLQFPVRMAVPAGATITVAGVGEVTLPTGTKVVAPQRKPFIWKPSRRPVRVPQASNALVGPLWIVIVAALVTSFGIGAEIGVAYVLTVGLSEASALGRVFAGVGLAIVWLLTLWYSVTAIQALANPQPGSSLSAASGTSFTL